MGERGAERLVKDWKLVEEARRLQWPWRGSGIEFEAFLLSVSSFWDNPRVPCVPEDIPLTWVTLYTQSQIKWPLLLT